MNGDQKILAHILARRLKTVLHYVIGKEHVAYIKGQSIHKGIQDLEFLLQAEETNWCLVTIDCVKAYDRVDRKYKFQMIRKNGLPERLITITENFHPKTTANISVIDFLSK